MSDIKSIARWEAKGGKRYVELFYAGGGYYIYYSNGGAGALHADTDEEAVLLMTAPWGPSFGPVTVLKADFPSAKRIF